MKFICADPEDLQEIYALFSTEVRLLNTSGNFQWNPDYPSLEDFESSLKKRQLYMFVDHREILAMAVLDEIQDPAYELIQWQYDKPAILHRFMVPHKHRRKSIGRKLLGNLERQAKESSYLSIRLDASETNVVSNAFYASEGYEERGRVKLEGLPGWFICYEKWIG